ncbi:TlpA disulfide reductase family protein [Aridibaculum aurantiacum]|uniref:TlpA disulfide reductase family protein n=1 Tax=Aridibaculum aurantiacum TaxID=2810307 RepID=UPI001A956901|nr:TlpA disulfide reductase family protein [Aridibaculum aurantiacum]
MRILLLLAAVLVGIMANSQEEKKFILKGKIKNINMPVEKVYLRYSNGGERRLDSAVVNKGSYTISNTIAEPVRATLSVKYVAAADGTPVKTNTARDYTAVFLSPTTISIVSVDSFSNTTVKGSAAHDEMKKLTALLKPYNDEIAQLSNQWREAKDEETKNKLTSLFEAVEVKSKEANKQYVQANPSSPIAIYAVNQFAGYDIDADKVQPVFDLLPANLKALPSAQDLAARIDIARKLGIGKTAIDFTQNDTAGVPVSLSSLRGKVLLVDFWASWCGPCRRDNPNVVKIFNQYRDKGFHVLGVSLDQPGAQERWIKAIHDDKLTWTHVSDLKFWENEVAKLYGIRAIPFNLLLDREGKIIARNLHGEELEKKLSEVLN